MRWESKHETGFKTFLNALDYSAVFWVAYQDHLSIENQMALIKATPTADEDSQCLSMPQTTRAGIFCARP